MSKIDKLTGKEAIHPTLGKVEVIGKEGNSRTRVKIRCIQRARGWDETRQAYRPVKQFKPNLNKEGVEIGKTFHQKTYSDRHSQYGHEDICHIDELKPIKQ